MPSPTRTEPGRTTTSNPNRRLATPRASSEDALRRMRRQRRRDTAPEIVLRSALHRSGLRFRVDYPLAGLRRRADLAFPTERVAVFVDGCFWHGCPEHGTAPKANAAWWRDKIAANVARDRETVVRLEEAGWLVVRVWEHEAVNHSAPRVASAVEARRRERARPAARAARANSPVRDVSTRHGGSPSET